MSVQRVKGKNYLGGGGEGKTKKTTGFWESSARERVGTDPILQSHRGKCQRGRAL